jgi:hypothetical protein
MRVVLIRATFSACCNRRKAVGRHVTRRFAPVAVLDDIVIVLRPGLDPVCSCSNDVPDVAAFDSVGRLTCRRRERVQSVIEISKESDDESHDSIVTCIVQVLRLRCAETKPLSERLQTFRIGGTNDASVKSNVTCLDHIDDVRLVNVDAIVLLDELDVIVEALADQDEWAPFTSRLIGAFVEHARDYSLHLLLSQEARRAEQEVLLRIVGTTVESIDHMAPFDHAHVECSNVCEQVFETAGGVIDELDDLLAVDDRKSQLRRRCGPEVFAPLTIPLHIERHEDCIPEPVRYAWERHRSLGEVVHLL